MSSWRKKDKKEEHGVGLQAKTVTNAMIRHWLTIFDVPAVICSDRGSQFVGTWFKTVCKHMGIRHAKTVAYHSRSNGRAEVARQQMFETFRQLHIDETGPELVQFAVEGAPGVPRPSGTHWTVAPSHPVSTGSSVTHCPVVEPWQSGPGCEFYDG